MATLWRNYWKILSLDAEPFQTIKQAKDGVWYALRLFFLVALLASVGMLAVAGQQLDRPNLAERAEHWSGQAAALAERMPPVIGKPLSDLLMNASDRLSRAAQALRAVQPPLGMQPSRLIRLFGEWLLVPFTLLAAWMGAILPLLLVGRFMGARGGLRQQTSLLLLAFAPQILTFLNYWPLDPRSPWGDVAAMLSFAALIWSLVIAVQSLAIANDLTRGQAAKILVVTGLIFYVAIPLILAAVGVAILSWIISLLI